MKQLSVSNWFRIKRFAWNQFKADKIPKLINCIVIIKRRRAAIHSYIIFIMQHSFVQGLQHWRLHVDRDCGWWHMLLAVSLITNYWRIKQNCIIWFRCYTIIGISRAPNCGGDEARNHAISCRPNFASFFPRIILRYYVHYGTTLHIWATMVGSLPIIAASILFHNEVWPFLLQRSLSTTVHIHNSALPQHLNTVGCQMLYYHCLMAVTLCKMDGPLSSSLSTTTRHFFGINSSLWPLWES